MLQLAVGLVVSSVGILTRAFDCAANMTPRAMYLRR